MKNVHLVLAVLFVLAARGAAGQQSLAPEAQIAAAVQAAPENRHVGSAVLGSDAAGKRSIIHSGSNDR
jgi:hypothetical protein